jgi:hypothetical protein
MRRYLSDKRMTPLGRVLAFVALGALLLSGLGLTNLTPTVRAHVPLASSAHVSATEQAALLGTRDAEARMNAGRAPTLADLLAAIAYESPANLPYTKGLTQAEVNYAYTEAIAHPLIGSGSQFINAAGDGFIIAGGYGLVVSTAICAGTGAETLGLSCAAAFGTAGAALAIGVLLKYLGQPTNGPSTNPAVEALGISLIQAEERQFAQIQNLTVSSLSVENTSENYLDYKASVAALLQLQNKTWNDALDLLQSGVAVALNSYGAGVMLQVATAEAETLYSFATTLGASDASGFGCQMDEVSANVHITAGLTSSGSCGGVSSSANEPYGNVTSMNTIGPTSTTPEQFYFNGGSPYVVTAASGTPLVLHDESQDGPHGRSGQTITLSTGVAGVLPTNGTGIWNATCATSSGCDAALVDNAFPVNLTGGGGAATLVWLSNGAGGYSAGSFSYQVGTTSAVTTGNNFVSASWNGNQLSGFTHNAGVGALSNLYSYLYTLAINAATVGKAYWEFLRSAGFTNVSQIPTNCLLVPPSDFISGTIPPSELATANATVIYNLYLAFLRGLAADFNFSLTSATFCNHPLPQPIGNTSANFGVFGIGYLYLPANTKNANGTATQHFATPTSWNASGEIFLAPPFMDITPKVNTTWELPKLQPTLAYIVPYLVPQKANVTGQKLNGGQIEANGPTVCVTTGVCDYYTQGSFVLSNLVGNSSRLNGSAFPANSTGSAGDALYFLECFDVVAGSNPNPLNDSFAKGGCYFNTSTISTGVGCVGILLIVNCGPTPPPIGAPTGTGFCNTFPIVAQLTASFGNIPVIGATLGCVLGILILVGIGAIILYVIVVAVRRGDD